MWLSTGPFIDLPNCNNGICIGLRNELHRPEHLEPLSMAHPLEVHVSFMCMADGDHVMRRLPAPLPQLYRIHNHSSHALSPCIHHLPCLHHLVSADPHSLSLSSIHRCFHVPDPPHLNTLHCRQYHCPFSLADATNVRRIDNHTSCDILNESLVVSPMRLRLVEDSFYLFCDFIPIFHMFLLLSFFSRTFFPFK